MNRPDRDPGQAEEIDLGRTTARGQEKAATLQGISIDQGVERAVGLEKEFIDRRKQPVGIQRDFGHPTDALSGGIAPTPSNARHSLVDGLLLRGRQHGIREKDRAERGRVGVPRKALKFILRRLKFPVGQILHADRPGRIPRRGLRRGVDVDLARLIVSPKCHPPHDGVTHRRGLVYRAPHPDGRLLAGVVIGRCRQGAVLKDIEPAHWHGQAGEVVGAGADRDHPSHIAPRDLLRVTETFDRRMTPRPRGSRINNRENGIIPIGIASVGNENWGVQIGEKPRLSIPSGIHVGCGRVTLERRPGDNHGFRGVELVKADGLASVIVGPNHPRLGGPGQLTPFGRGIADLSHHRLHRGVRELTGIDTRGRTFRGR